MCGGYGKQRYRVSFEEGMLKQSWKYRLKDEHRSEEWYELTLLRVDIEHPRRRKALLLWRHMEPLQPEADSDETGSVRTAGFFITY